MWIPPLWGPLSMRLLAVGRPERGFLRVDWRLEVTLFSLTAWSSLCLQEELVLTEKWNVKEVWVHLGNSRDREKGKQWKELKETLLFFFYCFFVQKNRPGIVLLKIIPRKVHFWTGVRSLFCTKTSRQAFLLATDTISENILNTVVDGVLWKWFHTAVTKLWGCVHHGCMEAFNKILPEGLKVIDIQQQFLLSSVNICTTLLPTDTLAKVFNLVLFLLLKNDSLLHISPCVDSQPLFPTCLLLLLFFLFFMALL